MPETPSASPRVAVLTMAHNEATMLPRWIDYYGRSVGINNLLVIDDNSTDGSTDDLPCTVLRIPPAPWKARWGRTRQQMVNNLARAYAAVHDVVIFTDTDEFLVPDPLRYDGLLDYVTQNPEREVMAALGLNVLHAPAVEGALEPGRSLLSQRHFVKFAPNMCKPSVKRIMAPWTPGFHGIKHAFTIDRDLWLLHLKYADLDHTLAVAHDRQRSFNELGRGHEESAWPVEPAALVSRQLSWVEGADLEHTPGFDSSEPDLTCVVTEARNGVFHSAGTQLHAMETSPLRRLPDRVRDAF